jgi:hypothetical protein
MYSTTASRLDRIPPKRESILSAKSLFRGNPQKPVFREGDCRSWLFRLVAGRGVPSSVALALDVNAVFHAVIFKRGKARGYFAVPKYFAIACVGASHPIAFVKDLYAIFLAFQSNRRQNRYLRSNNAFVSYDASVRLDCYEVARGR